MQHCVAGRGSEVAQSRQAVCLTVAAGRFTRLSSFVCHDAHRHVTAEAVVHRAGVHVHRTEDLGAGLLGDTRPR